MSNIRCVRGPGLTRALITFVRGPSSHAIKDGCFCFSSLRRSPPGPCPCSIILEAFNSSKIWPESLPALSASAWAFLIDCCSSLIYKGNGHCGSATCLLLLCCFNGLSDDASTAETTHVPPHQVSHPQPLYADCRWPPSDLRSCCKSCDRVRAVISCYGRDSTEPAGCDCGNLRSCSPSSR